MKDQGDMEKRVFVTPIPVTIDGENSPPLQDEKKPETEKPEVVNDKSVEDFVPKMSSSKAFFLLGTISFGVALIAQFHLSLKPWPDVWDIHDALSAEPERQKTNPSSFLVQRGDYVWDFYPYESVELNCLVLSAKPTSEWTSVAEPGRSKLVESDITVTWGSNADQGRYQQGQFGNTSEREFADNAHPSWDDSRHLYLALVSHSPEVGKAIRQMSPGDQCVLRGELVRYRLKGGDGTVVGEGHKVLHARSVEYLKKHNHLPTMIARSLALTGLVLYGLSFFNRVFPPSEDS